MHFVIRTQAHPAVGLGHLMRMLAFAEWLRLHGANVSVVLTQFSDAAFTKDFIDDIGKRVAENDVPLHWVPHADDISDAQHMLGRFADADGFILDSYTMRQSWIDEIAQSGRKVCLLDDHPTIQRSASVVVDPTLYSVRSGSENTSFSGADYFLCSPSLAFHHFNLTKVAAPSPEAVRWFVSFGGTDVLRMLPHTLRTLAELDHPSSQVCVAVSPAVVHAREIAEALNDYPGRTCWLHEPQQISTALAQSDFAIGAAGGMTLERALLGIPALVTQVADNQADIYQRLQDKNLCYTLEPEVFLQVTQLREKLRDILSQRHLWPEMSKRNLLLSQGLGGAWIAQYLTCGARRNIYLRRPGEDFCRRLFTWQTIPSVRQFSRNTSAPVWDEHCTWFARQQQRHPSVMAEILLGDQSVGMLRLDPRNIAPLEFEVSILIAPEFQGEGIAKTALWLARRLVPFGDFLAYIHPDNAASRKVFRNVGYVPDKMPDYFRQETIYAYPN